MEIQEANLSKHSRSQKIVGESWYEDFPNDHEYVLIAKDGDEVSGVLRLSEERGHVILRGVYIEGAKGKEDPKRQILEMLESHLQGSESYCLPYASEISFYRSFNYEVIRFLDAPIFLRSEMFLFNHTKQPANKKVRVIMKKIRAVKV